MPDPLQCQSVCNHINALQIALRLLQWCVLKIVNWGLLEIYIYENVDASVSAMDGCIEKCGFLTSGLPMFTVEFSTSSEAVVQLQLPNNPKSSTSMQSAD